MYEAFNTAADFIERNPHRYEFTTSQVPSRDCGQGCMWGWVAHFMGVKAGRNIRDVSGHPYKEMELYQFGTHMMATSVSPSKYNYGWAGGAANVMRAYAEAYLTKPIVLPVPVVAPALEPAYVRFRNGMRRWTSVGKVFKRREEETV